MLTIPTNPEFVLRIKQPKPVTPAADATSPRSPFGPTTGVPFTPGQQLGSAPAPLASPSIGAAMNPITVAMAAVAGVRAAIATRKAKGNL